ncbi:MAG: hypothetical protein ACFB12_08180 [Leptolyngbyaceae cyanobacterium]
MGFYRRKDLQSLLSRLSVRNHRHNLRILHKLVCPDRPADIRFADSLPKTRSGKIIRRFLRNLASGEDIVGDATTMEDQSVLDKLREGA